MAKMIVFVVFRLALTTSLLSEWREELRVGPLGLAVRAEGKSRTVFALITKRKHNPFSCQRALQFFLAFTLFDLLTEFTIHLFIC